MYFVLGNVYRGCGRKRCVISHAIGTFSSSVCCQFDYCNKSERYSSPTCTLIVLIIIFILNDKI